LGGELCSVLLVQPLLLQLESAARIHLRPLFVVDALL
jgi:hypothetical protein